MTINFENKESLDQIIDDYLAGRLSEQDALAFEEYYFIHDKVFHEVQLRKEMIEALRAGRKLPASIRLLPMKASQSLPRFYQPQPSVMAAETPEASTRQFELVARMISEEYQTIVRILRDDISKLFHLFVIAPTQELLTQIKRISFLDLGISLHPDAHGYASFTLPQFDKTVDWSEVTCQIDFENSDKQ
ncbi:MAG: hypothetical protein ACE5I1_20995 [bacterium]